MDNNITKTDAEIEAERQAYLRKVAALKSEISSLTTQKTNYESFKTGISNLSDKLNAMSKHISSSSDYLSRGLIMDGVVIGKASMDQTVTEVSGYVATLTGYIAEVDSKIREITTNLTSKQEELRRLG